MKSYYISNPALRVSVGGFGLALIGNPLSDPKPLPVYRSPDGTLWAGGTVGLEYGVEVVVPDTGRYGVLVTVDGLNVQNGNRSSGDPGAEDILVTNAPSGPGKNVIPGWIRPDGESVAAFEFSSDSDSYAAKMDLGIENAGVVGVRIAFERSRMVRSFGATRGMGTGYGREADFHLDAVSFEVDHSREFVTLILRYASETALQAAGFTKIDPSELNTAANPFPESRQRITGCPPPPGWTGR